MGEGPSWVLAGQFRRTEVRTEIRVPGSPQCWIRCITVRGKLSFLTLVPEWLDAPPHVRRTVSQEARSG